MTKPAAPVARVLSCRFFCVCVAFGAFVLSKKVELSHVAEYLWEASEINGQGQAHQDHNKPQEHSIKLFEDYSDLWVDRTSENSCWKNGREDIFANYNACCVDDEHPISFAQIQNGWPQNIMPIMLQVMAIRIPLLSSSLITITVTIDYQTKANQMFQVMLDILPIMSHQGMDICLKV